MAHALLMPHCMVNKRSLLIGSISLVFVTSLGGCGASAETPSSTASSNLSEDAGPDGGERLDAASALGILPQAPSILQGICFKADPVVHVIPLDELDFEGGIMSVNLSGNAVRLPAFDCNFTQAFVDATGHVKRKIIIRGTFADASVSPKDFVATLRSAPGVAASLVDVFVPDLQMAPFTPGTADYMLTLATDGPRAPSITDATESPALAALLTLTPDDLGVSDAGPQLDLVRTFVANGKSSLSLATAAKAAEALSVDHAERTSAHFSLGDRVTVASNGTTASGLVLRIHEDPVLLDALDILVVDGSNRLQIRKITKEDVISLVAGVTVL